MSSNLQESSDLELVTALMQGQFDLVRTRFKHAAGALENTSELRRLRRGIARVQTELRRRELAQGMSKDALLLTHRADVVIEREQAASEDSSGFLEGLVDKLED
ncbi:MAG: 50S ribosomal protein L29 [Myxococcota bacterium]